MNIWLPTILVSVSVVSTLVLGGFVLANNRRKITHRTFAAMCLNLALWSVGVIMIVNSQTEPQIHLWLHITLAIATFLPATFYTFILYFPEQRLDGARTILILAWVGAVVVAIGAFTPYHVTGIAITPDQPPKVEYGPVFQFYSLYLMTLFFLALVNLIRKLRVATGLARRQVQQVLLGIFVSMTLAISTNVLAPLFNFGSLEPYGPAFATLMMAWFAYAMVRYHLMDVWIFISRTTVYAVTTAFVAGTFFLSVTLMHWGSAAGGHEVSLLTSLLAGLFIAVVLQPMRERLQLVVDRIVLKRRYDTQALMARISRHASEIVNLYDLLNTVASDIVQTVGAAPVRVLLVDEDDPNALIVSYSTDHGEENTSPRVEGSLLEYVRRHAEPIVLEQLLHAQENPQDVRAAHQLAELDAYLCLPLKTTSGLIGLLTLGRKASRDIYTKDDIVAFTTVAGPLATAIENARLYQKLQESNLHRARILSTMRGGVVSVDADGRVSLVNQSAAEIFGPIELGQRLESLSPELANILQHTLGEHRGIRDFETMVVRPNGDEAHVAMSSSCLTTSEGDVTGALAMVYDLTRLKRLEQNVERADRLSSLGTLAAGMAHEIKNPLVSIKTFTQLLPIRYNDPDFLTTFSDVVPHEVDRIDSIVSRLLDFARPRATHFGPTDVRAVLQKVLALVENQAAKANVQLTHDWPEDPVYVRGDEQQLIQVFLNLLLNSLESIPKDRQGRVSTHISYDCMNVRREGMLPLLEIESVRVAVRDNGDGIRAEFMDHLFTPFFTTKENGSGLGLSVVHGIVSEHGGTIDVTNPPGGGAEFVVTLPMANRAVQLEDAK